MSKVTAYSHIVFATKYRRMTITNENREALYRFIWKISSEMNCQLKRINGIPNHIHILINIHPTVALADYVKRIKTRSSAWMRSSELFPYFEGWAKEYFSETISTNDVPNVVDYIKKQQEHHSIVDFGKELVELHTRCGLSPYENDFNV